MFGTDLCVSYGLLPLQLEYLLLHLCWNPIIYQEVSYMDCQCYYQGGCHIALLQCSVVDGYLLDVRPLWSRLTGRGASGTTAAGLCITPIGVGGGSLDPPGRLRSPLILVLLGVGSP